MKNKTTIKELMDSHKTEELHAMYDKETKKLRCEARISSSVFVFMVSSIIKDMDSDTMEKLALISDITREVLEGE